MLNSKEYRRAQQAIPDKSSSPLTEGHSTLSFLIVVNLVYEKIYYCITAHDFFSNCFPHFVWQPLSKKVNHVLFSWMIAKEKGEKGVLQTKFYFLTTFSFLQKCLSCYIFQCLSANINNYKTMVLIFPRMQTKKLVALMYLAAWPNG